MLLKKYTLNSLKRRLTFIIILVTILSLAATIMVSYVALQSVGRDKTENYLRTSLLQLTEQMSQSYYNMIRIAEQMNPDGSIGSIVDTYLSEDNKYELYRKRSLIRNELLDIELPNSYVNYIMYYDPDTKTSLFEDGIPDISNDSFDLPVLAEIGSSVYHGIHKSNRAFIERDVISLLQSVQFSNQKTLYTYIEMKMNTNDYIDYADEGLIINSDSLTFLQIDEHQKIQYSNNMDFPLDSSFDVESILQNKNKISEINGYYAIAEKSSFHFTNIILIPSKEYKSEMNLMLQRIVIIFSISLLLFIGSIFMIFRLIYRPIQLFEEELIKVGEGNFETDEYNFDIKEFNKLFFQFNEMKLHVKQLMIDIKESEAQKKQWEMETLMYQINPHFLMNTINSANWLARMHHANDLSTFLSELNAILAYKMGKGLRTTTFRTEIEMLNKYIYIQKMRYDFSVNMQVEEGSYLDFPTIKLLLQPLVENSLQYGINDKGQINIRIFLENSMHYIVVTIEDIGKGMTAETLKKVNAPFRYENNNSIGHDGIGLRYVKTMLNEYYGSQAILTINSELGKGTKVTILIPASPKPENDSEKC